MDDSLRTENRGTLATLAAAVSFPYIWLGLYLLLALMYGVNFFGQGLSGGLVAGLLCLGLLNPIVPGLISTFIARPIFLNLLGREIVSTSGCLIGLMVFVLIGLGTLFFIARDLTIAILVFFAAPVAGGALAFVVSAAGRGGLSLPLGRASGRAPSIKVTRPERPTITGRPNRPTLPGASQSTGSRLPLPRRGEQTGSTSKGRIPPPPRAKR